MNAHLFRSALALALLSTVLHPKPAVAADGDLDPSFGTGGIVTPRQVSGFEMVGDIARQAERASRRSARTVNGCSPRLAVCTRHHMTPSNVHCQRSKELLALPNCVTSRLCRNLPRLPVCYCFPWPAPEPRFIGRMAIDYLARSAASINPTLLMRSRRRSSVSALFAVSSPVCSRFSKMAVARR